MCLPWTLCPCCRMFLIQHQFLLRISPKLALDLMKATEQGRKASLSRNGIFFLYVENTMEIFRMCCPHGDVSHCPGPTENLLSETCKLIGHSWIAWECSFVIKVFALQSQGPEFNPQDPQKKLGTALRIWRQADLWDLLTSQSSPSQRERHLSRKPRWVAPEKWNWELIFGLHRHMCTSPTGICPSFHKFKNPGTMGRHILRFLEWTSHKDEPLSHCIVLLSSAERGGCGVGWWCGLNQGCSPL